MAKGGSEFAGRDWNVRRSPVNTDAPWPTADEAKARVLRIQTKLQPHPPHVQLGLRELTLDPQDQLVVEIAEVIDPVGVDHQRVGQPAVLKQPLRLRRGARQA